MLRYEDVDEPSPGPGEVVVRLGACGVNFIDTYQRTGAYKVALPHTAGQEGAGEIVAVGEGVTNVRSATASRSAERRRRTPSQRASPRTGW